jgi:hypothetical protein
VLYAQLKQELAKQQRVVDEARIELDRALVAKQNGQVTKGIVTDMDKAHAHALHRLGLLLSAYLSAMKVNVRDSLFNDLLVLFTEDRLARILDILLAGDGVTLAGLSRALTAIFSMGVEALRGPEEGLNGLTEKDIGRM